MTAIVESPVANHEHRSAFAAARGTWESLSGFVGRARELTEVSRLLDTSRLVTLTGAAGVGKSRLALALGEQCRSRFRDGTWLVELNPLSGGAQLPAAVAETLGLAEHTDRTVTDALTAQLADRRLLLVLDGCEHLGRASAELVERLVEGCPDVSVLATSREPLGVDREVTWRVPPLQLPDPDGAATPQETVQAEAVRLFVAQRRAVQPNFHLTAEETVTVAETCRWLDGIPLAIELAAAHTPSAPRIGAVRNGLLHCDGRGFGERRSQRTIMAAALDSSYRLLSEPQRTLLRRLSLFPAGCTVDAAQQVCSGGDVVAAEVPGLLAGLAAGSLAVAERSRHETRYRLLGAIRAYARHKLDQAGESRFYQARHASWCLALAESAGTELTSARDRVSMQRIETEHANLRAAIEWALVVGEGEPALRISAALTQFWRASGHFTEGVTLLERALAACGDAPAALRTRALWGVGFLGALLGGYERALAAAEKSLAAARELGDTKGIGRAFYLVGFIRAFAGEPQTALTLLQQAVGLARQEGDSWCLARALAARGWAHLLRGDAAQAHHWLQECVALARDTGDDQAATNGLIGLGSVALAQGRHGAAGASLSEALDLATALADRFATGVTTSLLNKLARRREDANGDGRTAAAGTPLHRPVSSSDRSRPRRNCVTGWASLTPSQEQTALLAGQGLTNQAIGQRLFISPRTVQTHLSHVYAKLDLSSRQELAWELARRDHEDD